MQAPGMGVLGGNESQDDQRGGMTTAHGQPRAEQSTGDRQRQERRPASFWA